MPKTAAEKKYIDEMKRINALGLEPAVPSADSDRRANNRYVDPKPEILQKLKESMEKEKKKFEEKKKKKELEQQMLGLPMTFDL